MNIEVDINKYMSRFKLMPKATTLFEPTRQDITNALLKKCCPLCGRKLYQTRNGKLWRCKSIRKDGFFIKNETLEKYK